MEHGAFEEKTRQAGDYDLSFMWFSYADPDTLRTIFFSGNIGNFNVAKYNDPEMDKLLLDAAAELDQEKRAALTPRSRSKVLDEAVTIPLGDSVTTTPSSPSWRVISSTSWPPTSG